MSEYVITEEQRRIDKIINKDSVQLGVWEGKDIIIEGLRYSFPKKPKKSDFINYGKVKKEQYWVRSTEYEKWKWNLDETKGDLWYDSPEEGQLEWYLKEIDRFVNGAWILIEGEEVYLNKYTYFFLQWFLLEDGTYPSFRDSILYYYRFLEICEKTPICVGHTLLKSRRMGATSMCLSAILLLAITTDNSNYGILSNKGGNAKKAFQRAVKAFGRIPPFLRPVQEGTTAPKQILSLREQAKRITKGTTRGEAQEGLNNEISWENTDLNSYDSYALIAVLADELGKYPKDVPANEYIDVLKECCKKGTRILGKIFAPTTVNPPDKGGEEYKIVWDGSDQLSKGSDTGTESGLFRIMIPSYIGLEGYITKYGQSIVDNPTPKQVELLKEVGCPDPTIGARQYLLEERAKSENNTESLQAKIRQYPFNAVEVFDSANSGCIFPNREQLIKRRKELEVKLEERGSVTDKDELGRRGWFHRINGVVQFVDDSSKGLWYVDKLLPENQSNKFSYDRLNKKKPENEEWGAGGADPVASGDTPLDGGSDACLIIRSRFNSLDPENTGKPEAMFLGRMDNPNKMHEQWYNALEYYGVKMLAERAPQNWLDYAVKEGLDNYLYGTIRSDGKEIKGINAQHSEAVKQDHAETQVLQALSDTDKVPFITLVRQRLGFNIRNRTIYDTCMADGYAGMALKIPFKKPERKKPKKFLKRGKVL